MPNTFQHRSDADPDVAIVGMACRFPGADDYHQFWQLLREGRTVTEPVPRGRWGAPAQARPSDRTVTSLPNAGWRFGSLGDIRRFDHTFFGVSAREAAAMDPQHRILLEEAYHCVEDAGIPPSELRKTTTAAFVGLFAMDYLLSLESSDIDIELHTQTGNYACGAPNRVSQYFGWTGKSMAIDTACASSLTVLHEARLALLRGECDYALAGAVKLMCHPLQHASFARGRLLSADGACRPFDHQAHGFAAGEGVGVLLLQRAKDAEAANNHIHAKLRGSAINHSGWRSQTLTAPSGAAQAAAVSSALEQAGVSPRTVGYVEAHCVGTAIGDAVEVTALNQVFSAAGVGTGQCKLGSVKGNIGHCDNAAGMSGVFKAILMMQHGEFVPTLQLERPNPLLGLADSPFSLATQVEPWPDPTGWPRRAGVSASGFTGSNAHVVLEASGVRVPGAAHKGPFPLLLSAKTAEGLAEQRQRLAQFLEQKGQQTPDLADLCYTQAISRSAGAHRFGALVTTIGELKSALVEPMTSQPAQEPAALCAYFERQPWDEVGQAVGFARGQEPILHSIHAAHERLLRIDERACATSHEALGLALSYGVWLGFEYVGVSHDIIAAACEAVWTGLVTAGMLTFEEGVLAAMGRLSVEDLPLRRPNRPFWEPVSQRVIAPYSYGPGYAEGLVEALVLSPDEFSRHTLLARQLFNTQHGFKRLILTWGAACERNGVPLVELITDVGRAEVFCSASRKRQGLLMHIILRALQTFGSRWGLPIGQTDNPALHALHSWLAAGFLEAETVVQWLAHPTATLRDLVETLNCYRTDLGADFDAVHGAGRLPWFHDVADVIHPHAWLAAYANHNSKPPQSLHLVHWTSGGVVVKPTLHRTHESQPNGWQALVDLWLLGQDVVWDRTFPKNLLRKVPLPTYPFNPQPHWYPPRPQPLQSPPDQANLEAMSDLELMAIFDTLQQRRRLEVMP